MLFQESAGYIHIMPNLHPHIFGPEPSRRLGRSLGIDLVPFKTCSYDCIYCQSGPTTNKTIERKEYVPLKDLVRELYEAFQQNIQADFITLSGSGEPTLYSRIPELLSVIRSLSDKPIAVLTNGSLLWDPQVQEDLSEADLVIPSLDAGDERLFNLVNRPDDQVSFQRMVEGLIAFRHGFSKTIWLEVLLLDGVTGIESEVRKIAHLASEIRPDRIQLNTVVRPPAESFAYPVHQEAMQALAAYFHGHVEVIAKYQENRKPAQFRVRKQQIIDLLKRRPCTLEDIRTGLHMHRHEVMKYLEPLIRVSVIITKIKESAVFYCYSRNASR